MSNEHFYGRGAAEASFSDLSNEHFYGPPGAAEANCSDAHDKTRAHNDYVFHTTLVIMSLETIDHGSSDGVRKNRAAHAARRV